MNVSPLLYFFADFNTQCSRDNNLSHLSSGYSSEDNGRFIVSLTIHNEATQITFPNLGSSLNHHERVLQLNGFEYSQSSSFLFLSQLIKISACHSENDTDVMNIDMEILDEFEVSIDLEYILKLCDHVFPFVRTPPRSDVSANFDKSRLRPSRKKTQFMISAQSRPIQINLGDFQIQTSKLSVQCDLSNQKGFDLQITRIALIQSINSLVLIEVGNVCACKHKIEFQQLGIFHGNWYAIMSYANTCYRIFSQTKYLTHVLALYQHDITHTDSAIVNQKKDSISVYLNMVTISPIPNCSISSRVEFVEGTAHIRGFMMNVHDDCGDPGTRMHSLFQPINLTVNFENIIRVNILDMNFSFTFIDMNILDDVLKLITRDISKFYNGSSDHKGVDTLQDEKVAPKETFIQTPFTLLVEVNLIQWTLRDLSKGNFSNWNLCLC